MIWVMKLTTMSYSGFIRPGRQRQHGLALVIVIWILTLLTLMAGSFAMTMRRDTSVSSAIKNNAQALAQAEGGIALAQYMLAQPDPRQRWLSDGTIYRLVFADGEIRIKISSEAGKVDINTSGEQQLAALLLWATADDDWLQQQLLNAILDWRDADDDTRTMGAERRQYRLAGLKYAPGNSPFQSVQELQLVLGMNEIIYRAIAPYITVYSGQGNVDLASASPELLAILSAGYKRQHIDDQAIQNRLNAVDATDVEQDGMDEDLGGDLGGLNQTYTIIAEVVRHDEASAGLEAVVQSQASDTDSPFQILEWKQKLQGASLFDNAGAYPIITISDEFRYHDRY